VSDITGYKNTIMTFFDNRQTMKMSRALGTLWKDPLIPFEQKLDFLGELTIKDSEYFMEKVYPGIQIQNRRAPISEINKMDEYMFKNYCSLAGEEIKTMFHGNVADKKTVTSGRIYLTNYRILVCGNQVVRSAQKKVQVGRPSLVGALVRSGVTHHRKAIRKAINKAFRKDLEEWNLGEWGYYFPIYNVRNIKRGKKSVSYAIDVETEKKPISLGITVTPLRLKKQPKVEFQEQKEGLLDQVEDLLKQYQ